jgi:hypothetical protein
MPANPASIDVTYLTGQGRAFGSPTAVIRHVIFVDQFNDEPTDDPAFSAETFLNPELQLGLDQYTAQTIAVPAAIPASVETRFFDTFFLEVSKLRVENASGGFDEFEGSNGQGVVNEQFALKARAFRSRHTTVPIFLDDAMLNLNGSNQVTFDRNQFETINYDPTSQQIIGFLSDYVAFDISAMATVDRPTMPSNATPAARAYFSGDGQAISSAGTSGPFDVLTPSGFIEGTFLRSQAANTYTLVQLDPRDLTNTAKITAMLGIFRDYTSVFAQLGTFEFFTFPNSDDNNLQDLVMLQRNGAGAIVNFYYGLADLQAGTYMAWPIRNIDDGSVANQIDGTITNIVDMNGNSASGDIPTARAGQFTITPSVDVPAGFPASGRFVVFRR